jgi:hypothetical protein
LKSETKPNHVTKAKKNPRRDSNPKIPVKVHRAGRPNPETAITIGKNGNLVHPNSRHICGASQVGSTGGAGPRGKRLLTRIKEILNERAIKQDENGNIIGNTRFDTVAHSFVEAMENGSFAHLKEFIDREEGRSTSGTNNVDVKMYINMPTEGPEAP